MYPLRIFATSLWLSGLLLPPVTHLSSYLKLLSSPPSGVVSFLQYMSIPPSLLSRLRYAVCSVDIALLLATYCSISITYFACIIPLCHIIPNLLYNPFPCVIVACLCSSHVFLWCLVLIYLSQRAQVTKEMKTKHLWRQCSGADAVGKTIGAFKPSASYKMGDVVRGSGDTYWQLTATIRKGTSKHSSGSSAHGHAPPASPLPAAIMRWHDMLGAVFAKDACALPASPVFHAALLVLFGHCTSLFIAALLLPHAVLVACFLC